ncbi:MAG: bacillithiol system redox-active protein YtxJ [Planctomycetota bacterium]|nr:bacillithiol system redox-active protein YtxJ [Planctomycetota bacterium]
MDPVQIADEAALDEVLGAPSFLLLKHSPICPISARAFEEYRAFVAEHPDVPTAWLDVIGQRPLSRAVEARTGIGHESPQALWIRDGAVAWSASHEGITRASLAELL